MSDRIRTLPLRSLRTLLLRVIAKIIHWLNFSTNEISAEAADERKLPKIGEGQFVCGDCGQWNQSIPAVELQGVMD